MKNIPIWLLVLVLIAPLVAILFTFLAQHKIHNIPLEKRRKKLLIILGTLIIFFLIMTIISLIKEIPFWQDLFSNIGFLILCLLIIVNFLYAFFRKLHASGGQRSGQ